MLRHLLQRRKFPPGLRPFFLSLTGSNRPERFKTPAWACGGSTPQRCKNSRRNNVEPVKNRQCTYFYKHLKVRFVPDFSPFQNFLTHKRSECCSRAFRSLPRTKIPSKALEMLMCPRKEKTFTSADEIPKNIGTFFPKHQSPTHADTSYVTSATGASVCPCIMHVG